MTRRRIVFMEIRWVQSLKFHILMRVLEVIQYQSVKQAELIMRFMDQRVIFY